MSQDYMNQDYVDKESLVIKYLPLVKKVAGRIYIKDRKYEEEDLIHIGVIGLMDAIEKYDHKKNVPFEAYATLRIRGSIIDELRRGGVVSRDRIAKLNEYYRAKEILENRLLRTPEESEVCKELGIGKKELSRLHETIHCLSYTSLDSIIFTNQDSEVQLIDVIEDEESIAPEKEFIEKERKELLLESIDELNHREKLILNLYYVEELTLKKIAYILGISIPRVSQIHGKTLLKLRNLMEPKLGEI